MRRLVAGLSLASAFTVCAHQVRAQSCMGYPALATGPLNVSTDIAIGSDWYGIGGDVNYNYKETGAFASGGVGTIRFVTDPKESRFSYGVLGGWEKYSKDQLIWCPYATFSGERGSTVYAGTDSARTISGTVIGLGFGAGFEVERRGPLSFNPFLMARMIRVNTKVERPSGNFDTAETGALFGFGLGVRINEAIEVAPSFSGSTLEGANLVFDLRVSVALRFRK